MGKLATEYDAYQVGGGTGYSSYRLCTNARAHTLGCVKNMNYEDGRLMLTDELESRKKTYRIWFTDNINVQGLFLTPRHWADSPVRGNGYVLYGEDSVDLDPNNPFYDDLYEYWDWTIAYDTMLRNPTYGNVIGDRIEWEYDADNPSNCGLWIPGSEGRNIDYADYGYGGFVPVYTGDYNSSISENYQIDVWCIHNNGNPNNILNDSNHVRVIGGAVWLGAFVLRPCDIYFSQISGWEDYDIHYVENSYGFSHYYYVHGSGNY